MYLYLPLSQLIRVLKFYLGFFFKHGRLPSPFKTGFFKDAIQQGTASLLCLVDPKVFARHFIHEEKDHLHFLLSIQKDMEKPIYIIPQLILYKKTPEKDRSNLLDVFFWTYSLDLRKTPELLEKLPCFSDITVMRLSISQDHSI
jgi:glycerol-3-phosphate O-acyltransferase